MMKGGYLFVKKARILCAFRLRCRSLSEVEMPPKRRASVVEPVRLATRPPTRMPDASPRPTDAARAYPKDVELPLAMCFYIRFLCLFLPNFYIKHAKNVDCRRDSSQFYQSYPF